MTSESLRSKECPEKAAVAQNMLSLKWLCSNLDQTAVWRSVATFKNRIFKDHGRTSPASCFGWIEQTSETNLHGPAVMLCHAVLKPACYLLASRARVSNTAQVRRTTKARHQCVGLCACVKMYASQKVQLWFSGP